MDATRSARDVLVKEMFYPHAMEDVWNAITQADRIGAWFLQADFKPEPGYRYTFQRGDTRVVGEVLRAEPMHTLIYTWMVNDTNVYTTVHWHLRAQDEGTLVTLEHSGIMGYPTEELAATMFGHFEGGWRNCFSDLALYLKKEAHGR